MPRILRTTYGQELPSLGGLLPAELRNNIHPDKQKPRPGFIVKNRRIQSPALVGRFAGEPETKKPRSFSEARPSERPVSGTIRCRGTGRTRRDGAAGGWRRSPWSAYS